MVESCGHSVSSPLRPRMKPGRSFSVPGTIAGFVAGVNYFPIIIRRAFFLILIYGIKIDNCKATGLARINESYQSGAATGERTFRCYEIGV